MSEFEFDASDFINKLSGTEARALDSGVTAVRDSLDDLDRIASNIAPINLSNLRKSSHKTVGLESNGVVGELNFSIIEKSGNRRFNYALWTHEMDYGLGPRSQGAGGSDGYAVGNKYVERPLKGESDRYIKEWAEAITKGIGR